MRFYANAANTRYPTDSYYVAFSKDKFVNTFVREASKIDVNADEVTRDEELQKALNAALKAATENNDVYNRFSVTFDTAKFMTRFITYAYNPAPNEEEPEYNALVAKTTAGMEAGLRDSINEFVETLKQVLQTGIDVGQKITVYGINHKITDEEWEAGTTVDSNGNTAYCFPNRVYTSALSIDENSSLKVLHGTADWKVYKRTTDNLDLHFYKWSQDDNYVIPASYFKEAFVNDNRDINALADYDIYLSSSGGFIQSVNINRNADVLDDGTGVAYRNDTGYVGDDVFYYRLGKTHNAGTEDEQLELLDGVAKVTMYIYDVADNLYVLDYGLPVELNGDNFGLMKNDSLYIRANHYGTDSFITSVEEPKSEKFGKFIFDRDNLSLKYKMNDFMSDVDSVTVYVVVVEDGTSITTLNDINITNGVVMHELVETAPANVMYYEDDFDALTYVESDGGGDWAVYKAIAEDGTTLVGTEQSADQSLNFGYDPNYVESKTEKDTADGGADGVMEGWLALDGDKNAEDILHGDASNGTIHELVVEKSDKVSAEVLNFKFKGTGFEIIARGLKENYGIYSVKVEKIITDEETGEIIYLTEAQAAGQNNTYPAGDGKYYMVESKPVKQMPVIMEATGEDVYQVPVMSIKDLPYADYRVTVVAMTSTNKVTRKVYVDGIRIFDPLDPNKAQTYYPPDEFGAKFYQVKDLINGDTTKVTFADEDNAYHDKSDWASSAPDWSYQYVDLGKSMADDNVKATDLVSDIIFTPSPKYEKDFYVDIAYICCFGSESDAKAFMNKEKAGEECSIVPTEVLDDVNIVDNPSIRVDVEEGYNRVTTLNKVAYIAYETSSENTVSDMRYCVVKYRTCGISNGKQSLSLRTVGQAVFADVTNGRHKITAATRGTTLIEDLDSIHTLVTTPHTSVYLSDGPNNEIYLEGDSGFSGIAFYLYPEEGYSEADRTIQIEAHRKMEPSYGKNTGGYATLVYGSSTYELLTEQNKIRIASGTEQYFTIDPKNLTCEEVDGRLRYTVYIAAGISDKYSNSLALSTLKVCGYTIGF